MAAAIRKNLSELEATSAEVCQRDAIEFLKNAEPKPFDIVFLDPPFDTELLSNSCNLLRENGWLKVNAIIYLEHSRDTEKQVLPDGWVVTQEKVAGKVSYSLVTTGKQP